MAEAELQSLQLKVTSNAKSAKKGLDALVDTLEKVEKATAGGCGLGSVASGLEKVDKANTKVVRSNNSSSASFAKLATKVAAAAIALKKVGGTIASWINESNEYEENINLFSAALGRCSVSVEDYAKNASEAMADIENGNSGNLPLHLKNTYSFDPNQTAYKYPHDYPGSWVDQQYLPDVIKDAKYYHPKASSKYEISLMERYNKIEEIKARNKQKQNRN